MSYGETVTHNVNLSQFDNTEALVKFVKQLPQQTGFKTMTFRGIDTARYSPLNPSDESPGWVTAGNLLPCRKEAFVPERGARQGVKKVMVIVTDGESHDFHHLDKVIADCDADDIERFGIAVSINRLCALALGALMFLKASCLLASSGFRRLQSAEQKRSGNTEVHQRNSVDLQ